MVGLVLGWMLRFKLDDERVRCGLDIRYSEAHMLCGELTDESYVQESEFGFRGLRSNYSLVGL